MAAANDKLSAGPSDLNPPDILQLVKTANSPVGVCIDCNNVLHGQVKKHVGLRLMDFT